MTAAPDSVPDDASSGGTRPDLEPGTIVVTIGDDRIVVDMTGGGSWSLPVGVVTLFDGPLEQADRPRAEQLTNALGAVMDHVDDVLIEAPIVASTPAIVFAGPHAQMVARVELGVDEVPQDYVLRRTDADEVFRTIVAEPRSERVHNPGLDPAHVDTVVAGCCSMLAFFRRLDHQSARVVA